ncbi:adenylate cyclase [Trinickia symbiotica]|uniref:Adenylate cyclase n=1 Tax=Trinickia symbiotica TaxID=863227 RepID=A0A2T3Y0X2_9BURK|nr:class IV adenylate cyclase [Trinickia symbiotica]PTB22388.1 adenylate cyclase [Trinickia symbiotica]
MARNVEIKARIESVAGLARRVAPMATEEPTVINQDDTFFHCANGRLKLRQFDDGTGQLIFYKRPDQHGPKESFYVLSATSSPDSLRDALALAYGVLGRVRKQRLLYMVGRTRVHLDKVEGLGEFMELEVVLEEDESTDDGNREAASLMEQLEIEDSQLIDGAYLDLLKQITG